MGRPVELDAVRDRRSDLDRAGSARRRSTVVLHRVLADSSKQPPSSL
jgi:hypothetical protein